MVKRCGWAFVLAFLASLTPGARAGENLELEVCIQRKSAWVGDVLPVELRLRGDTIRQVVAKTPGFHRSAKGGAWLGHERPDQFVLRFEVRPEQAGELVLGPYEIEVMGRKLRSNRLVVTVSEPPRSAREITLALDKASADVGEELVLTISGRTERALDVQLAPNPRFQKVSEGTSKQIQIAGGKSERRFIRTVRLKPLRKGNLQLGKQNLANLPPGARVNEVVVEVR